MARRRMIVWRGPSALDKTTPTVVLATYDTRTEQGSQNAKTGPMPQFWIMRDDINPAQALQQGLDTAICGDCPHRSRASGGSGACYVQVSYRGPLSIWNAYKSRELRGEPGGLPFDAEAFRGRKVRLGAYGDPAVAPFELWEQIAEVASAVTGYTHAWRYCDPRFARRFMASADSPQDTEAAHAKGYRVFEVRPEGAPKPRGLVQCPAAAEAGKRATCSTCMACNGTASGRRSSISIEAHGSSRRRFRSLPLTVA